MVRTVIGLFLTHVYFCLIITTNCSLSLYVLGCRINCYEKYITKFGYDSHITLSAKRTNLCYVGPEWLEVQLSKYSVSMVLSAKRWILFCIIFVWISICNQVLIAVRDTDWNSRALGNSFLFGLCWNWSEPERCSIGSTIAYH